MENLAHSRLPNRLSMNGTGNVASGGSKTMHPDFFGVPNLSPRAEDYREIFGSFNSRAPSIPVLVLPELDEADLYFDVRSSGFRYSELFGDLDGSDFAPSYEDLFRPSVADSSSFEEARTPAEAESLPDEPDHCIEDPCFSIEDPYQSFEVSTEFGLSYPKSGQNMEEDLSNNMAEAETCFFAADLTAPRPSLAAADHNKECNGELMGVKQLRRVVSEPQRGYDIDTNGSHCKGFVTISDISLQTEPSHLPPPSRPPPLVDASGSTSKCKSLESTGTRCDSSSFFDVEVDATSSAAVSAISMNEVRKAPEIMGSVKQLSRRSVEEKRRGRRSSFSSVKYEDPRRRESEKKPKELYKSEIKGREVIDHENIANWVKEALQQDANDKRFKEAVERDDKKKLQVACQRAENEKILVEALQQIEDEKKLVWAVAQEENEIKLKEDREREGKERRQRKTREREDNEKRLKETREREENENKLWEAREEKERRQRMTCKKEEIEDRLKVDREEEENVKRLKETREKENNERRLKKERERNQNEKRLKETCKREERERRLKEIREREGNDERLCEAWKQEENQKQVKEDCEREDNVKRKKEAHEIEENEKGWRGALEKEERAEKGKEAKERNDSEKKFSEASEKEDILRRAEEFWQKENNSKILGNGLEREESETRLDAFVLKETEKAPKEATRWKETESLLKDASERKDLEGLNKVCDQTKLDEELELPNLTDKGNAFMHHGNVRGEPENSDKNSKAVEMESLVVDERNNTSSVKWRRESEQKGENLTVENDVELHLLECNLKKVGDDGIEGGKKCTNRGRKKWVANGGKIEVVWPAVLEIRGNTQKPDKQEHAKQRTMSKDSKTCVLEVKETERIERKWELDQKHLQEKEEEMEREREREKDRMAVDKAILEAREGSREKAEETAVKRVSAEAQHKALSDARERLEKACAEARGMSLPDKASMESKLRMERTAVERATTEARERAVFEARERIERSVSDNYSGISRISRMQQCSSSSDLHDLNSQSSGSFDDSRNLNSSVSGASYDAERFEVAEDESSQRCRARLERHQRMEERAAKALEEKNMRDLLAIREQEERNRLSETLDAEVKRWSSGKHGNLRALLSTLQYILGSSSGWQPIPLTEVITNAAVKKAYRKATLCIHPDKLQQRGASIQQKYICEKVYDLLKEAWNKFNSEER